MPKLLKSNSFGLCVALVAAALMMAFGVGDPEPDGRDFVDSPHEVMERISFRGRTFNLTYIGSYEDGCEYSGFYTRQGDGVTLHSYTGVIRQFRITKDHEILCLQDEGSDRLKEIQ